MQEVLTLTGQLADLDWLPEVTVRLAVYTPAVPKDLLQLVEEPEQAPDQVYEYEPVPPDTEEIKVTVWLVVAETGEAEQLTIKVG